MINKVTIKEEPTLFNDIVEFSVQENKDHRRGSNFYRDDIIEFTDGDSKYFPEITDFSKYVGFWKTNNVLWDSEYGFEDESYSELSRVKRIEVIERTIKYELI